MSYDADVAYDSDNPYDPAPSVYLRATTNTYGIPGGEWLTPPVCTVFGVCDTCSTDATYSAIPEGYCDPTYSDTVTLTCPESSPLCIPVWWIKLVIAKFQPLCGGWLSAFPLVCTDFDAFYVDFAFVIESPCCWLDCWSAFIDRRGDETCITLEDVFAYITAQPSPELYRRCLRAFEMLRIWWGRSHRRLTMLHCYGLTIDDPIAHPNGPMVTKKRIQFPQGTQLLRTRCDTIAFDSDHCECPNLL